MSHGSLMITAQAIKSRAHQIATELPDLWKEHDELKAENARLRAALENLVDAFWRIKNSGEEARAADSRLYGWLSNKYIPEAEAALKMEVEL